MDYRAYPILYVDDEVTNLQAMQYLLEDRFTVVTTHDPEAALTMLAQQDFAVLLADQRMPRMTGTEVCRRALELKPDTVRILITAYADLHTAIDAVNLGQIRRYLTKPHPEEELVEALRTAIDFFHLNRSLREMEVRVLRSGTQATALAVRGELADELMALHGTLTTGLDHLGDLLAAGLQGTGGMARITELIRGAQRANQAATVVADKLGGLVKRLREGSTIRTAASARCDAVRAIDAMVRIMRSEIERHGSLEFQVRATPVVPLEASALGHVLMQLLTNAAQARGDRPEDRHRIVVTVEAGGGEALISVGDNGVGITPEARERLFDPRFTTHPDRAGLGLAIVRELVSSVGGKIDIFSEVGVGTTMTVRLPLVSATP